MKLGSDDDGQFTLLDILSIISFCVGLQNLELNLAQEDLDNQTQELDSRLRIQVEDIHNHLKEQDRKIDLILEVLYDKDKEVGQND